MVSIVESIVVEVVAKGRDHHRNHVEMSKLGNYIKFSFFKHQKHKLGDISAMQVVMVLDILSVTLLNLIEKQQEFVFIKLPEVVFSLW